MGKRRPNNKKPAGAAGNTAAAQIASSAQEVWVAKDGPFRPAPDSYSVGLSSDSSAEVTGARRTASVPKASAPGAGTSQQRHIGQLPAGQGRTLSAPADAPAAPIDAPTTADAHIATGGNSSISRSGTKHPVPKEGPMMATNRKDTKAAADTSSNRSGSSGQAAPGATIFTTTSTTTGGVTAAVVAAAQSVLQATRAGKSQAELEEGLGGAPADSKAGSRDTVAAAGVGAAAAGNKGSSSSTASSSTNARKALSNNTSSSREVQSGAEAVASKADDSTAPPSEAATAAVSAPVAGGSTATSQTGTDAKEGGRYTSSSSSGGGNEELPLVDTEQPDVAPAGRVSQPLAQQDAAAESGQTGGSSDNRQAKEVPQVEIEQLAKGTAGRQQPQTPAATTADNALPPSTAAVDTLVQQQQQQQPEVSRPPPTGTSSTKAAQQQTAARIAAAASQDDTTSDIPSIQPAVAASTQPAAASSGVCTAQATARHSALSPHTLKPQDDTDQAPAASTTAAAEAAAAMQPAAPQGGSRTTVSPPPHSRTRTPTAPPAPPAYDTEVAAEAAASIAAIAAASSSLKPFPPELLPAVGTCPGLTPANMQVLTVWYNKFCCDTEAQQRLALYGHCQPGMLFEDNFIKVSGQPLVDVQFYALKRVLQGVELVPEKIEVLHPHPAAGAATAAAGGGPSDVAGSNTYRLRIISQIRFKLWEWRRHPLLCVMFPALLLLPETITSWVTDELTVNSADNKLMAYKQRIHNIPTAPTPVRWLLGLASSCTLMLLLGW